MAKLSSEAVPAMGLARKASAAGLLDHEAELFGSGFAQGALAQKANDAVLEVLATEGPFVNPGEVLNTRAQSVKANDTGRFAQDLAQFLPQNREEEKFGIRAGLQGEQGEVELKNSCGDAG